MIISEKIKDISWGMRQYVKNKLHRKHIVYYVKDYYCNKYKVGYTAEGAGRIEEINKYWGSVLILDMWVYDDKKTALKMEKEHRKRIIKKENMFIIDGEIMMKAE